MEFSQYQLLCLVGGAKMSFHNIIRIADHPLRADQSAMCAIYDSVGKFCRDVRTRRTGSVQMEQKERKEHERQESASSSRRNGFSNCFSCRSYSSNTSFVLLVLLSVQNFPTESFIAHTADLSALCGSSGISIIL